MKISMDISFPIIPPQISEPYPPLSNPAERRYPSHYAKREVSHSRHEPRPE